MEMRILAFIKGIWILAPEWFLCTKLSSIQPSPALGSCFLDSLNCMNPSNYLLNYPPINLFEIWELFSLVTKHRCSDLQASRIINETQSVILRSLLPALGYSQEYQGRKMTKAETELAKQAMTGIGLEQLIDFVEKGKPMLQINRGSPQSQATYKSRLHQFFQWCEAQPWWDTNQSHRSRKRNQYCPKLKQGYGQATQHHLTDRRQSLLRYSLSPSASPSHLNQELDEFYCFLTSSKYPGRLIKAIKSSSADVYLSDIRLFLGWFHYYQEIPKDELRCNVLIPYVSSTTLDSMQSEQQNKIWNTKKTYLDTWLCHYFQFLREQAKSESPRTRKFKVQALVSLAKFLYRREVDFKEEYQKIPIFKILERHSQSIRRECRKWDSLGRCVVDMQKWWPEVVEGQTSLKTLRKKLVEFLRQACKPKYDNWHFRNGTALASSYQRFLAWSLLTEIPPRRQQEHRSLRIALNCPVERPSWVPRNGLYHPHLPHLERERNSENRIIDNYLYRTYQCNGIHYSEGVWVLDIHEYKTAQRYGSQAIVLPNRSFPDGTCFYDYIERYLYGWWRLEENSQLPVYDWWDKHLLGCQGQWLMAGRCGYNPKDHGTTDQAGDLFCKWGYFFVQPRAGTGFDRREYSRMVSNAAHSAIGKRIAPKYLRDIWATWAFQVGLSDAQIQSLAYCMGHDIKTLRNVYNRCSPEEKRRPIEDAIDELLLEVLKPNEEIRLSTDLENLASDLLQLPEKSFETLVTQYLRIDFNESTEKSS